MVPLPDPTSAHPPPPPNSHRFGPHHLTPRLATINSPFSRFLNSPLTSAARQCVGAAAA
jgi:hypothetical protein